MTRPLTLVTAAVAAVGLAAAAAAQNKPADGEDEEQPPLAGEIDKTAGDRKHGEELAKQHCARCHVIKGYNPYGGLGNSPTFNRLVTWDNGIWRMSTFFDRPPHPVFTRVEGVPRKSNTPSATATFKLDIQDIEDIVAYAKALRAKEQAKAEASD